MLADISPQRVDKAAGRRVRPPARLSSSTWCTLAARQIASLISPRCLPAYSREWWVQNESVTQRPHARCQNETIWHFPFEIWLVVISFCIQLAWRVTEPSLSLFLIFFLLLFCFGTKRDNHYYVSKAEQLWLQRGKEKRKMHSGWGAIGKSKYTVWLVCLLSHNSPHSESIILLQSFSNNCF